MNGNQRRVIDGQSARVITLHDVPGNRASSVNPQCRVGDRHSTTPDFHS
jgi:hypothetical protein